MKKAPPPAPALFAKRKCAIAPRSGDIPHLKNFLLLFLFTMKNDNNKKAVAVLYLVAAVISLVFAVIYQNYLVMCVGAMWHCLGVLNLKK